MENITFYLLLVTICQGKRVTEWNENNPNIRHVSVSYSDSLRCYGGKGGGKFQECHQDDGYKTCFTKYENGKQIAQYRLQIYIRNKYRREGGAGLCDQEADAVRGVRGAQE